MYWYAAEPLAGQDAGRALKLTATGKIPLAFAFMRKAHAQNRHACGADRRAGRRARPALEEARRYSFRFSRRSTRGLKGRRQFPMPKTWPAMSGPLLKSADTEVGTRRQPPWAMTFGDPLGARQAANGIGERWFAAGSASAGTRCPAGGQGLAVGRRRLQKLGSARRHCVPRRCVGWLYTMTPTRQKSCSRLYPQLSLEEKRDALATLAARVNYATALLTAVADKKIPPTDLPADLVRQMRNRKNQAINDRISELWGTARESTPRRPS